MVPARRSDVHVSAARDRVRASHSCRRAGGRYLVLREDRPRRHHRYRAGGHCGQYAFRRMDLALRLAKKGQRDVTSVMQEPANTALGETLFASDSASAGELRMRIGADGRLLGLRTGTEDVRRVPPGHTGTGSAIPAASRRRRHLTATIANPCTPPSRPRSCTAPSYPGSNPAPSA